MEFKKAAIVGMGAVGSYIYWGLSKKEGIDLCVIADGERKAALESEGIFINGENYKPVVRTPEEAKGADLIIVSVKYNALNDAVKDIAKIADEHTCLISVMNGVDSEEIIAREIGEEKIIYSIIKVASERRGNTVKFDPETTIGLVYGEKDPSRGSERVDALNALFAGTELHYRSTDVILSEIWSKFLLNVGNNLAQAVVGIGVGGYTDSEHMAFLKKKLREEVLAIAKAKGIDVTLADKSAARGSKVAPRARYSTLQDLDAKRHTEIDMFSGAVVRMGAELSIPTPYNEYTYHVIKAIEEKNDGKFDYE